MNLTARPGMKLFTNHLEFSKYKIPPAKFLSRACLQAILSCLLTSILFNVFIPSARALRFQASLQSSTQNLIQSPSQYLAQTPTVPEGTCYVTVQQVGVYQEPNVQSAAVGVLPASAVVAVGQGSGQGWIRVAEPIVGWVQAVVLVPHTDGTCTTPVPIVPSTTTTPAPSPAPSPTPPASTPTTVTVATCQIVAQEGLPVRNQPISHDRTLLAILAPGVYQFQFTDRRVQLATGTETREWVYISAPVAGWISTQVVGEETTGLVGQNCG